MSDDLRFAVIVSGVVKWFDVAKGVGLIAPDTKLGDVVLPLSCLRRSGFEEAREGTRIVCKAIQRPGGLEAFDIISMRTPTPADFGQQESQTAVIAFPASRFEPAQVKWFNRLIGMGFLTRGEGTADILFHIKKLRGFDLAEVHPGTLVRVRYERGPKSLVAVDVRPGASDEDYELAEQLGEEVLSTPDEELLAEVAEDFGDTRALAVEFDQIVENLLPDSFDHASNELVHVQVKSFNQREGFCFLTPGDGEPDIFCDMETLRRFGITELRPGQSVWVRCRNGLNRLMAAEVWLHDSGRSKA
jgi:CspA family cold shock protein